MTATVNDDLLNLVVEIKGYRGENAKDKANTMDAYWVPGVNNLGAFGRWAFASSGSGLRDCRQFRRADRAHHRPPGGMSAYLYILHCADGSYYVGTTRNNLETRIDDHQAGAFDGYTARRRPVTLVFQQHFDRIDDAVAAERQVKGWRREKKEALIRGDFLALPSLSRRAVRPSRRAPVSAPQHEVGL